MPGLGRDGGLREHPEARKARLASETEAKARREATMKAFDARAIDGLKDRFARKDGRAIQEFDPEKMKTAKQIGEEEGWSLQGLGETGDNAGSQDTHANFTEHDTRQAHEETLRDRGSVEQQTVHERVKRGNKAPTLSRADQGRVAGRTLEGLGETGGNVGAIDQTWVQDKKREEEERLAAIEAAKEGGAFDWQMLDENAEVSVSVAEKRKRLANMMEEEDVESEEVEKKQTG